MIGGQATAQTQPEYNLTCEGFARDRQPYIGIAVGLIICTGVFYKLKSLKLILITQIKTPTQVTPNRTARLGGRLASALGYKLGKPGAEVDRAGKDAC